ncbi:hypothetical protein Tco_0034818, partial [Tanacetum coccineum]
VKHEQVLEDEELSNDTSLQRTMNKNLFSYLLRRFIGKGQEEYAVDNKGKKSFMFSARRAIRKDKPSFKLSPQSRFFF